MDYKIINYANNEIHTLINLKNEKENKKNMLTIFFKNLLYFNK